MSEDHVEPRPTRLQRPVPSVPARITIVGSNESAAFPTDYRSHGLQKIEPLVLRYRWRSAQTIFLLFFACAWNSFLVLWYSIAIFSNGPWIMFVFPVVHIAVGIFVAKSALASLLNTTVFSLDCDRLHVSTGPIRWPWNGPVSLPTSELRQLSVLETRGRKGGRSYGVIAHLADGTTTPLLKDLPDEPHAAFIERVLEWHIGLVDDPSMNRVD